MTTSNTSDVEITPIIEITTIHTENGTSIHVEHFFDIQELENDGLKLNKTLLFCRARHFLNEPQTIYQELIRMFWWNVEFANEKAVTFL